MIRFLAASLLALLASSAIADTFQVTRTNDPWPNGCLPGDCSLREAIEAAEANAAGAGMDIVVLPAGTYTLSDGLDPLSQTVRVQGPASEQTRIVLPVEFTDIFSVEAGSQLALAGLTLDTLGTAVDGCYDGIQGAPMSFDDVVFEDGNLLTCGTTTVRGSQIRTSLYVNYGQTVAEDSEIRDIIVQGGESSELTLRRVLVDGALDPDNPDVAGVGVIRGALIVEDSTITQTDILLDGLSGALTLRRVHYLDNIGPIRTETGAIVNIEDSLFEDNGVRALYAAGGAEWNVTGSTFANNRVDGNAGGAIVLEDDSYLAIRNSTFSGNTFTVDAAADGARGAAIGYRNGEGARLILQHVTIVPPSLLPAGIVGTTVGGLGGDVSVDLANSILRGTCGMDAGVLSSSAGNIESAGNTCGLAVPGNYVDISAASLALGALGDNGGPTPTRLPNPGSYAIDRASMPFGCVSSDQRGYYRPGSNATCDIGAVEADGIPPPAVFADGFE